MKDCTYCGRENEDGREACHECGTPLTATDTVRPVATGRGWVWSRRAGSAILGFVLVAVPGAEFSYLSRAEIAFYTLVPFVPVAAVWFAAGRYRFVEGFAWLILLTEGMLVLG